MKEGWPDRRKRNWWNFPATICPTQIHFHRNRVGKSRMWNDDRRGHLMFLYLQCPGLRGQPPILLYTRLWPNGDGHTAEYIYTEESPRWKISLAITNYRSTRTYWKKSQWTGPLMVTPSSICLLFGFILANEHWLPVFPMPDDLLAGDRVPSRWRWSIWLDIRVRRTHWLHFVSVTPTPAGISPNENRKVYSICHWMEISE